MIEKLPRENINLLMNLIEGKCKTNIPQHEIFAAAILELDYCFIYIINVLKEQEKAKVFKNENN